MPALLRRLVGLLLLTLALGASSCQALVQRGPSVNVPGQLSPGSFQHER